MPNILPRIENKPKKVDFLEKLVSLLFSISHMHGISKFFYLFIYLIFIQDAPLTYIGDFQGIVVNIK